MDSQLLSVSPRARMLKVDYGSAPKDYQAGPIRITFRYEIPDYALAGDGELLLKPMVMNNLYTSVLSFLRIDTDLETRRYGFRDACSRLVELDEVITLPRGYRLAGQSRSEQRTSPAADFEGSLRQDGNKLLLKQKLALKKRIYRAADWEGFRSAVNAYKSFADYLIVKP